MKSKLPSVVHRASVWFLWPLLAVLVILYSPSCSFCSGHPGFSNPPISLMHCCPVHWHLWFSLFGQLFHFPPPLQVLSKLATCCYAGPSSNNLLPDNHFSSLLSQVGPSPCSFSFTWSGFMFSPPKILLFTCLFTYLIPALSATH